MSLFTSMQLAANSLNAQQIGLQVTGQNIANANTPGYIRETVNFNPAPTQRIGKLLLGLGVNVASITQVTDAYLDQRLRGATSDRASNETQEAVYQQIENIIGELGETDLSTSMNNFFSSISEILNQPESTSVRNLAVLQGKTLAGDIQQMAKRVAQVRTDLNDRVIGAAKAINRLLEEIRTLNVRITEAEGGSVGASDAVGLRDQRAIALNNLSQLVDVRADEQPNGSVSIFTGGDYLVIGGEARHVKIVSYSDRGLPVSEIRIAQTDSPLSFVAGEVAGLIAGRDEIAAGFLDQLDTFAGTLAFEFNKVFSSGQGLTGLSNWTSTFFVDNKDRPLDAAGLSFTPVNGSFQIEVLNTRTGLKQTTEITVDLNGLDQDTSLASLATQLNNVAGISATITTEGRLTLATTGADTKFGFANDTSHVLAALGLNTFFDGDSATGIKVNDAFLKDPSKFAASGGGIGVDTKTAIKLAGFLDAPLDSRGGASLSILYDRLTIETTQASTVSHAVAEGARVFESALAGQQLSITGVNLDEEAIRMIQYQKVYQASARYIQTIKEMLDALVNI